MANTQGKNRKYIKAISNNFVYNFLIYTLRIIFIVFLVLMVLLIWTDDLYDYTNWDFALGFQLLGFLGLMAGFAIFFFKPKISGWIILISSLFFWIVTIIFHGMFWLGTLFLVFPLLGILVIVLDKLNNFASMQRRK